MTNKLRFDDKVVIVTGAGGALGRAYAKAYAARGAKVVVSDLFPKAADATVEEIKNDGGVAVANYNNVTEGDKIVEHAVKEFGSVHIVINNAGILKDVSFKNITEEQWDEIYQIHVHGAFKVAHAAWPYMRKQKFGRIINTTSAAGLYGNFGQTNYSAAKLGLVGFTETLAKEGHKYNITANVVAPLAASPMTKTIMPEEILQKLQPSYVVPTVLYLTHENTQETWGIYEVAGGAVTKLRWARSTGTFFKPDDSFTPSAILNRWEEVMNEDSEDYPNGPADAMGSLEKSISLPPNKQGDKVDFKDQVIIVTGGGNGLGRAYSLLAGKLGAKVVVNDFAKENAEAVVAEIKKNGGEAVADGNNVVNGQAVVKTAIDNYGTVHAVINNAGILRDKSFLKVTEKEWMQVIDVHLKGTFAVTKAAWPYFLKQKYGRVVNTASTSGIYGNFGQSNYATAKMGILGFSRALALEGKKYNIFVNTIAPNAATNMTKSVFTEEMLEMLKPDYVAPCSVLLASDSCPETGKLFEVGSGVIRRTRWQRTGGHAWKNQMTPEDIANKWQLITDFEDGRATNPESNQESAMTLMGLAEEATDESTGEGEEGEVEKGYYEYDADKIILYNLGVGAGIDKLDYVYENRENFQPVPTFGVIPYFSVPSGFLQEVVPNFNPMKLLHGEQYLEILQWPIPEAAKLETNANVLDVVDKGKAAVVTTEFTSTDMETGKPVFYNVSTTFLRGSGGFGGPKKGKDRGAVTAANTPPSRNPDFTAECKVGKDQAALYRLSGDKNPLHVDPDFAAVGGFKEPILHGLCSMGISGRILNDHFGHFKNIKVRFTGHVFPGETLKVVAWKENNKIIFETHVVERGTKAISAAAIELAPKDSASKL